jgi:hypothetical protein
MSSLYLLPEMPTSEAQHCFTTPCRCHQGGPIFSAFQAFFMSQIYAGGIPINGMTNSELLPKQPRGRLSVDEGHP